MANILAFDTSSESCSVAVCTEGNTETTWSKTLSGAGQHSRHIFELIQQVLSEANVAKSDLDAIAVTIGPGSFTGLRVACSVAQGLAYALEVPIVAITSLELLAYQAKCLAPQAEYALATLDARMDEVYWGVYDITSDLPELQESLHVSPPENIVIKQTVSSACAIGAGLRYNERFDDAVIEICSTTFEDVMPAAQSMLHLALHKFNQGERVEALALEPLYIRDEVTWKKYQPALKIIGQ